MIRHDIAPFISCDNSNQKTIFHLAFAWDSLFPREPKNCRTLPSTSRPSPDLTGPPPGARVHHQGGGAGLAAGQAGGDAAQARLGPERRGFTGGGELPLHVAVLW